MSLRNLLIRKIIIVGMVLIAGFLTGCEGRAKSCEGRADELGQLEVSMVVPSDTGRIEMQLYEGDSTDGTLVEEVTTTSIPETGFQETFQCLEPGEYTVTAQAFGGGEVEVDPCCPDHPRFDDNSVLYNGMGVISVGAGDTEELSLILLQNLVFIPCNTLPYEIASVTVADQTVVPTELDSGVTGDVYIDQGENPITFTVTGSDCNIPPHTIKWSVKDGPLQEDADVGTIVGDNTGPSISWQHPGSGQYYANVEVTDVDVNTTSFALTVNITNE